MNNGPILHVDLSAIAANWRLLASRFGGQECAGVVKADAYGLGMAAVAPALAEAGLADVKMLMQVHDELVFELPQGDVEAATKVIRHIMETAAEPAIKLTVPLGVEIGTGPSWGAAH